MNGLDGNGFDERVAALLRSREFSAWWAQVDATKGCAAPIHLRGSCASWIPTARC